MTTFRSPLLLSSFLAVTLVACGGVEEPFEPQTQAVQGEDNGTELFAQVTLGVAHCDGGSALVPLQVVLTTTGAVDSALIDVVLRVDRGTPRTLATVEPQDFDHFGRVKTATFTLMSTVPTGARSLELCFVQSGAQGREEKQTCVTVAIVGSLCAPERDAGPPAGNPRDAGPDPTQTRDGGYHEPTRDAGYHEPSRDAGYHEPSRDGGYHQPTRDGGMDCGPDAGAPTCPADAFAGDLVNRQSFCGPNDPSTIAIRAVGTFGSNATVLISSPTGCNLQGTLRHPNTCGYEFNWAVKNENSGPGNYTFTISGAGKTMRITRYLNCPP